MTQSILRPMDLTEPVKDRSRAIGAILVEQGRLRPSDIDEIHRFASANGIRFGDAALQMRLLSQSDIDLAIALQFNYPLIARGPRGVSDDVVAAYLPQSEYVEPLRALRSQLMLRWPNDEGNKVFAVTSPGRGEGRSWLAANLAVVFAQIGKRTLLIDADMRHPRQHELFYLNNSVGLSALLTGRAGRESATRVNPQLRLFVLPAGILPPNPQELLGRPVFQVILQLFTQQFDVVILDTPATSEASDAQIISTLAGTAIMLARRNKTLHSDLAAASQAFFHSGVNIIGSVINEH